MSMRSWLKSFLDVSMRNCFLIGMRSWLKRCLEEHA